MEKRRFGTVSLVGTVGFFLAIAPVLDPYIIVEIGSRFTLKINDLLMLLLTAICFSKSHKFAYRSGFLCTWLVGLGVISLIANIGSDTNAANSMKNLIVWLIYAFCLMYLWKTPCRKEFFYWVEIIALAASILVFFQFVGGYVGVSIWDGRIPGIGLGKYDGWAGYIDVNTGDIRPNGFFQEASYMGIYASIAYAQAFKEEKLKRMIVYAIAMAMTTSMVAIVILAVVTLLTLILQKKIDVSAKMVRRVLFLVVVAVALIIVAAASNQAIGKSLTYIIKRITNFSSDLKGTRMSSTKYRIIGHIALFKEYSFFQKLFGVGIAQYATYFGVKSYSNVWVTTILNCGITGIIYLAFSALKMLKWVRKEDIVFFAIFVLVLSSDWQWFSWYFFALISACILRNNVEKSSVQKFK